jgi:hypothetical protein
LRRGKFWQPASDEETTIQESEAIAATLAHTRSAARARAWVR